MLEKPMVVCAGTRPEIVKLAPVALALRARGRPMVWIDTAQHQQAVTDPLYDFFDIQVTHRLRMHSGLGLSELNARLLAALSALIGMLCPACVCVQGDTVSALQASMAAFFERVPVAHVEAGLRSGDLASPFPEELNRSVIARLAHWNFAPTAQAAQMLDKENVPGERRVVGNTVVDALRIARQRLGGMKSAASELLPVPRLWLQGRRLLLVSAHRRENWGAPMRRIAQAVRTVLERDPGLCCIWVLHPNPALVDDVRAAFADAPPALRVRLVPPQGYAQMLTLMQRAWVVLSDSGGLQEEATSLHVPILITRSETERPEVLSCGAGALVGTQSQTIITALTAMRSDPNRHWRMSHTGANPFGDGHAAERIVETMLGAAPGQGCDSATRD